MAGNVRGVQAILREKQPMALFVHCGAQCANLVAKDSCDASVLIRNALYTINEVGRLFSDSLKFRDKFADLCVAENQSPKKLQPLCPTRWTVRLQAVDAVLDRYDEVLATVEELGAGRSHIAPRAAGLHAQLRKQLTLLALHMARVVLSPLDRLNKILQGSHCTVSKLVSSVQLTKELLQAERDGADDSIQGFLKGRRLNAIRLSSCLARSAFQLVSRESECSIVRLVRLLLTLPASSTTAERSFSALRRLKTWLRSTMGQARLNALTVCHVHRDRVAAVSADRVAAAFISLNARRARVFGPM